MNKIHHGDCIEVMKSMEENSVEAVVCDPPYELTSITKRFGKKGAAPAKHGTDGRFSRLGKGFMGRTWDGTGIAMRPEVWGECLRVAKPGAYLLAFGGTRTFHRLACAIEDAGWTLRDTMMWCYGSGFPKSHDVSKALDHNAGAEREVVGKDKSKWRKASNYGGGKYGEMRQSDYETKSTITTPATPEAKQWDGFGTALKPAWEPVILAQAPLEGTYAENVLKWGCGALNIDGCRIGTEKHIVHGKSAGDFQPGSGKAKKDYRQVEGRWPANFLLSHSLFCEKVGEHEEEGYVINRFTDGAKPFGGGAGHPYESEQRGKEVVEEWRCVPDCPVAILDGQSGTLKSGRLGPGHSDRGKEASILGSFSGRIIDREFGNDQGGASRFFYCAKASRDERNAGLEEVNALFEKREAAEDKIQHRVNPGGLENDPRWGPKVSKNPHPTVKPIEILRYLCRLITPPNGIVLDPFAGSGSTGCAAVLEGFQFVGIEKEREYVEIMRSRIEHWAKQRRVS